jgi:peptidoglycan glycosyltransferase
MRWSLTASIRRLAGLILLAFAALTPILLYWQVIAAGELTARPDNPRLLAQELRVQRGWMYDRHGHTLVKNRILPDGRSQRLYLYPSLSHITGFFSPRFGTSGLEKAFNDTLRGLPQPDLWTELENSLLHRPQVGQDLVLTIDLALQQAVEKAMGEAQGAAVVLDPKTGAILALYSRPYFDPNRLARLEDPAGVEAYWAALNRDPQRPLLNRATQGLYPPGSTFKTVTLAAALETGAALLSDRYSFTLRPPDAQHRYAWHANRFTSCENHPQTGSFDLAGAYGLSCNVVFSELGLKLGAPTLIDYARRFGLGDKPPLEIAALPSQISHTKDYFSGEERFYALASTAFGQGELAVTPLQMALVAAAAANQGRIPKPYLVEEIRDKKGQVLWQARPETWKEAMQPATAALVKEAMVKAAEEGWAFRARPPGIMVGGKTGTAEHGQGGKPHAWFIGFAPAEAPRVAIALIKERAGPSTIEAAPVARLIFEAALAQGP